MACRLYVLCYITSTYCADMQQTHTNNTFTGERAQFKFSDSSTQRI